MKKFFKKSKNQKILLVLILVVIIPSTIFLVVFLLQEKVNQARDELIRENFALESLFRSGEKIQKYREARLRIEEKKELIDNSMIKTGQEIKLIEEIESLAIQRNVFLEIKEYTPPKKKTKAGEDETEKKEEKIKELASHFMLSATGDYVEVVLFIEKLENLARVVNIESIEINQISDLDAERVFEKKESGLDLVSCKIIISYSVEK